MLKRKDVVDRLERRLAMRGMSLNMEEYSQAVNTLSKCSTVSSMDRRMDVVLNSVGINSLKDQSKNKVYRGRGKWNQVDRF